MPHSDRVSARDDSLLQAIIGVSGEVAKIMIEVSYWCFKVALVGMDSITMSY